MEIKEDEISSGELNKIGMYLLQQKKHEKAIKYFDKAIEKDEDYLDAYYNKAIVYLSLGKVEEALKCYEFVLEKHPMEGEAIYQKGNIMLYAKKNIEEAISLYNKAVYLGTRKENLFYNLAQCYEKQGEYDKAISWIDRAISLNSKDPDLYNKKAGILQSKGNYSEALDNYNKVLMMEADNEEANHFKSLLLAEMGQYEKALDSLIKAEEMMGERIIFDYDKVLIYERLGRMKEALEVIEKCEEIKGENNIILDKKATIYFRMKEIEKSIEIYDKLIKNNKENMEWYYKKANILIVSERYEEAAEAFNYIVENSKEEDTLKINSYYYKALALKLSKDEASQEAYRVAIREYTSLIVKYPYKGSLYILKANALRDTGDNEKAEKMYGYGIELQAEHKEYYLMRAKNRIAMGEKEEAQKDIKCALDGNKEYMAIVEADKELRECCNM